MDNTHPSPKDEWRLTEVDEGDEEEGGGGVLYASYVCKSSHWQVKNPPISSIIESITTKWLSLYSAYNVASHIVLEN